MPTCNLKPSRDSKRRIRISDLSPADKVVADSFIQIYRFEDRKVAKVCQPAQLAQAKAMQYVREKTSLPVPEVYDAYIDEYANRGVVIMEYVEGDVLQDVWADLTAEQQCSIVAQLKGYMEELRTLKGIFIGPVDGSPGYDPTFETEEPFGPFKTESEFNEGLIKVMKMSRDSIWVEHVADFLRALPQHNIVFTHADLAPRNILVRKDQIVAFLDWEMAGFYPEYWEYVKALFYPDWESKWIKDNAVLKFLQPWPLEHAVLLHVQQIVQGW
ncbi:hypothetical protein PRK78_001304 [Emydomyces testavorans]|uniref:Aminoglycoside phosphotransferase domain-containing protein n=1 Tax=Emydomyces testavorans TaxID=2070801 RepID=A0AAF0IFD3_9EURO|nr:hypothetical protein PRK78_001304 [Emydomyces testavorans]